MDDCAKLVRYNVMLGLPIMSCYAMARVNKRWCEVWQDDYFWFLKVKHDYPELYLPYKNSQFKYVYRSELRRQELLAKFKFGGSFESEPRLDQSENTGVWTQNDDLTTCRLVAILSKLAGYRIWDEDDVVLYGIYDDKYFFKIYGTEFDLEYVYNKDANIRHFEDELKELVNLTEPCYCGSEIGDEIWTHLDEYFNLTAATPLWPYDSFKRRHENFETICLLEGEEEDIKDRFQLLDSTSAGEGGTHIIGTHFGRNFSIYREKNKIMLNVEPLLSTRLIDDLKNILLTLT